MELNRRFLAASAALGAAFLFASRANAIETYSGETFLSLARQSADVMRLALEQQRYELELDRVPGFTAMLSYRASPAQFRLSNGGVAAGGLARAGAVIGIGGGKPSSDFSWFVGFHVDEAYTSQWGNFTKRLETVDAYYEQYLLTARLAYQGFSLSYGYLGQQTHGLNALGQFGAEPNWRPGTPEEVRGTTKDTKNNASSHTFSLRHKAGVGLGAAIAEVNKVAADQTMQTAQELAALKLTASPEQLLREIALFHLGIDRFAESIDYYRDRAIAVQDSLSSGTAVVEPPKGALYQVPLGVDDLLGLGIHARVIPEVAPRVQLRQVQAGWVYQTEPERGAGGAQFFAGARAGAVNRNGKFSPSFDSGTGIISHGFSVGFSYSYNTPDPISYFPIPNAHVVGMQLGWQAAMPTIQGMPVISKKGRRD